MEKKCILKHEKIFENIKKVSIKTYIIAKKIYLYKVEFLFIKESRFT